MVREVEGHEGLEGSARWQGGKDAVPVGQGEGCGRDRWTQIRHDDGATEQGRTARWQTDTEGQVSPAQHLTV